MNAWLHSVTMPAGPLAGRIDDLWWLMFWVTSGVFVAVVIALALAINKGRHGSAEGTPQSSLVRSVTTATGVTVVILAVLLIASERAGRAITTFGDPNALEIELTANQWWWNVEYLHPQPSERVTTANEIHVPVGRPVFIRLKSNDVIHSFWIPSLQGKTDLIPGRTNGIWVQADRAGTYSGLCAEYCGAQHAHMGLLVFAQTPQDFDRWLNNEHQEGQAPATSDVLRGREVFERGPCAMCHAIQGTLAGARVGPDLTHIGARQTLAAGLMSNTPDNMAAWLKDPQQFKPGAKMPATGLSDEELRALVGYMESLK